MMQDGDTAIRKHSVRIAGHATSISLENAFWNAFKAICKQRNMSVNDLLTEIDRGRGGNLSSAVRVYVLDQLRQETRHRTHAADERLS